MKKRVVSIMLTVAMIASMSSFAVFADSSSSELDRMTASDKAALLEYVKKADLDGLEEDFGEYIKIASPKDECIRYQGDTLTMKYTVYDTWIDYYTAPAVMITDYDVAEIIDVVLPDRFVNKNDTTSYTFTYKLSSSKFAVGEAYAFIVLALPAGSDGNYADGMTFSEVIGSDKFMVPFNGIVSNIRKVYKPTSSKVVAGKRQVTVSWTSPQVNKTYYVYRSLKKSSGYKLVKKTTGKKFVDKNVKKGKRYYYKIKARSTYGTTYTKFTTPKRSGRVK